LKGRGLQPRRQLSKEIYGTAEGRALSKTGSQLSNHDSEKNKFRKRFPKELPALHRGLAGTITFALQQTLPKADQRKNLIGNH
jgi:hypothetical protein